MRQWDRGPGRAITDTFPFKDHRSLAEVAMNERATELAKILKAAKTFDRTSFTTSTAE